MVGLLAARETLQGAVHAGCTHATPHRRETTQMHGRWRCGLHPPHQVAGQSSRIIDRSINIILIMRLLLILTVPLHVIFVLFCYWEKCNFSHMNTNFRLACFSHVISTKYINVSFMIHIFDLRKRTLLPYDV